MKLEKYKVPIIFIVFIILMLLSVPLWNKIISKDNEETPNEPTYLDVSDANNVANVDAKLGEDIRITTGYLLTYTTKKSSIWYMSEAYVVNIKKDKDTSIITLSADKDSQDYLTATISTKTSIKKNDNVYFVGNIDLSNGYIKLTKISTEPINYQDIEEIEFSALYENINLLNQTTFTISGYMITDNDTYKLFDSKTSYQNNNNAGNYFLINWQDKFNLTGNDDVKINCSLNGTYELKNCILQ